MSKIVNAITLLAEQQPKKQALDDAIRTYSYKELATEIKQAANKLRAFQGQTLAIDIANSAAWVIIDLACMAHSICTVPLPAFFTPTQREHALVSSGATAVLTTSNNDDDEHFISGGQSIAIHKQDTKAVKLPALTAKITYTSGSTGSPKGVCLSLVAMEQVATSLVTVLGKEVAQHTAAILPLPILLENIAGCYATLLAGGCYHIHPAQQIGFAHPNVPDFSQLQHYLTQIKASSCILVPELLRGLMHAITTANSITPVATILPAMKYMAVGGSKISSTLLEQAQMLNLPVYQGYGLSEAASVVSVNRPDKNQQTSVGQVLPHITLSINKVGELVLEHPAFLGYIGDETRPEYFATGDLGEVDQHGFVHLSGRKKNLLITSLGRNISPEWPESELLSQPEIMQGMVVGDGEAYLSALVVSSSPHVCEQHIDAAIARVNQRLPAYAQIKQWINVQPFSLQNKQLTGTGRIRRDVILQQYAAQIDLLYLSNTTL
jgi:long-subunit acyl-CoA synthetase (AMP-forming)